MMRGNSSSALKQRRPSVDLLRSVANPGWPNGRVCGHFVSCPPPVKVSQ